LKTGADPERARAASLRVLRALRIAGHETYFAGGCVRDLLLGTMPSDFDVATAARPEEVEALFERTEPVGRQFGVILVIEDGWPVEVATFRTEGAYTDGRRPDDVTYTRDPTEDVQRRDFTINGLLLDPDTDEVRDRVGGREDIEARRIRAIGDPTRRFAEDRLRMLRAVRFAAVLDFEIEAGTASAIEAQAEQIAAVSGERIRDELLRMLVTRGAARGVRLMHDLGLLGVLLPEVQAMAGVPQPEEYHPEGDVLEHTLQTLAALETPSPALALGALLHDLGKPQTFEVRDRIRFHGHDRRGAELAEQVVARLKLSRAEAGRVVTLVREHMRIADAPMMRRSTLRRLLAEPHFEELLLLHRADCLASHGRLDCYEFCRRAQAELDQEPAMPPPLLRGGDLIALGLAPGPLFGEILRQLQDARLEGAVSTREQALDWVRANYFDQLPKS